MLIVIGVSKIHPMIPLTLRNKNIISYNIYLVKLICRLCVVSPIDVHTFEDDSVLLMDRAFLRVQFARRVNQIEPLISFRHAHLSHSWING